MKQEFNVNTEGVLVLCAPTGLKAYFQDKKFDYMYPEGILPLINNGTTLAFTIESGDPVCLQVVVDEASSTDNLFDHLQDLGQYQIQIQGNEPLYILDHGTFTQTCDWYQGDLSKFEFDEEYNPKVLLEGLPEGWYQVQAYGQPLEDFEARECYVEMVLVWQPLAQKTNIIVEDVVGI